MFSQWFYLRLTSSRLFKSLWCIAICCLLRYADDVLNTAEKAHYGIYKDSCAATDIDSASEAYKTPKLNRSLQFDDEAVATAMEPQKDSPGDLCKQFLCHSPAHLRRQDPEVGYNPGDDFDLDMDNYPTLDEPAEKPAQEPIEVETLVETMLDMKSKRSLRSLTHLRHLRHLSKRCLLRKSSTRQRRNTEETAQLGTRNG